METVVTPSKLGKNQFKCFHCRQVRASKDGDWHEWGSMEVHLCRVCEKATKDDPKRSASRKG